MKARYTYADKLSEVRHELARRKKKYRHLIGSDQMSPKTAARLIEIMESIERDYAALSEHEKTES